MRNKMRGLVVALSLFVFSSAAQAQKLSRDVSEALNWMPPQSETLAVARGPVPLLRRGEKGFGSWRDWPTATPYFSLSNLQLSTIAPLLPGRVVESSLEARANFRAPADLGLMLYDGCGVVRLRPLRGETRGVLRLKLSHGAKQTLRVAEQQVSVFEEKREQDLWRIYVAVPRDNLVVVATNRQFLEEVLQRMSQKTTQNRAFTSAWSGWKLVDTSAPFWAVRRLDLPQSIGIDQPKDRQARALAIYQQRGAAKPSLIFKLQSANPKSGIHLFDIMKSEIRSGLKTRKIAPDITQITAVDVNQAMVNFYVLGFLGTGVFV